MPEAACTWRTSSDIPTSSDLLSHDCECADRKRGAGRLPSETGRRRRCRSRRTFARCSRRRARCSRRWRRRSAPVDRADGTGTPNSLYDGAHHAAVGQGDYQSWRRHAEVDHLLHERGTGPRGTRSPRSPPARRRTATRQGNQVVADQRLDELFVDALVDDEDRKPSDAQTEPRAAVRRRRSTTSTLYWRHAARDAFGKLDIGRIGVVLCRPERISSQFVVSDLFWPSGAVADRVARRRCAQCGAPVPRVADTPPYEDAPMTGWCVE